MKSAPDVELVACLPNLVGECPMWHPAEQKLYWVDTRKPAIQRLEPDGKITTWPMPELIGSFVFRRSGGLIAALKSGFCKVDLVTGRVETIVNPEPDRPTNKLNDGRCDRRGRFWCGSSGAMTGKGAAALHRFDPDFTTHQMDSGFTVGNGMAFSPDDRTMIFGDSREDTVFRYDFDLDAGTISNRQVYLSTEHMPWNIDGATFDAEGFYWCALLNDWAIGRFDPKGRLDRIVRMPVQRPTMCNFGGPDLDILYVTSASINLIADERQQPLAGALFAVRGLGVRGVPEPCFAG